MITGVQDIYLNVSDMARATAFYRDLLGLTPLEATDWWSAFDCGGVRLGLHYTGGDPVPPIPHDAHGPHCGAVLTLRTEDIATTVATLSAAGVTFLGPLAHEPWGSLATLQDPDGNLLKLMQPPAEAAS
ncbi:MAG: hypothetical protein GEEBNDBF_02433 [bacterium]|nr:hypothetical protein [bacterium]